MILDHVPDRTRLLVEIAPPLDADRFGHGDLDVVDVIAVPNRLEDSLAEPEDEEVLDGFLSQEVVDPVHLLSPEHRKNLPVERAGARKVAPERFFDDQAPEAGEARGGSRKGRRPDSPDQGSVMSRGNGGIEDDVARDPPAGAQGPDAILQSRVARRVFEIRRVVEKPCGKRIPSGGVERLRGQRMRGIPQQAPERIVRICGSRDAQHRKAFREEIFLVESEEIGDEQAPGKVPRCAEDHQQARRGRPDPRPLVGLVRRTGCSRHLCYSFSFFGTAGWTACPPNSLRSAASIRIAKEFSCRERKRIKRNKPIAGRGTPASIDRSTIHRPSPESSTYGESPASPGSRDNARPASSSSHERTTLPRFQRAAIAGRSRGKGAVWRISNPSAYACIIPYSIPLWIIFTKWPAP